MGLTSSEREALLDSLDADRDQFFAEHPEYVARIRPFTPGEFVNEYADNHATGTLEICVSLHMFSSTPLYGNVQFGGLTEAELNVFIKMHLRTRDMFALDGINRFAERFEDGET